MELQRQMNSGMSGNPQVSDDQERKWNRERTSLQSQLKMITEQMEQNKKFQESFLSAISSGNAVRTGSPDKKDHSKYKEKNKELLTTNKNLSEQI